MAEALRLAAELDQYLYSVPAHPLCTDAAAELRRLHPYETAYKEWHEKTEWVQTTARPGEFGMHRADVMRQRLEQAKAQRDALLEALKEIAADYADRFDLDSPSTNPGIKFTIKQARAAIKAVEEGK